MDRCFFCGEICGDTNHIKDYLKPTFTNFDIIKCPNSYLICDECVWAISTGIQTITLIDGEQREKQSPRFYSWIITRANKIAATKAHIHQLRDIIFNPPEPPFKIVLTDSGQKHLLFRAKWAVERDNYPIQFEEKQIIINITELKNRVIIADTLSAAIGKVAITNCEKMSYAITIQNYFNDLSNYEVWLNIYREPLSRLAAWLAKNKQEAQDEYPAINAGTVSAAISRADRSVKKDGRIRDKSDDRRDCQLSFDLT